jgi:hypothetical protein
VSSEDRRKSEDRWISYKEYEVQGRIQVSLEGFRFLLEGIRFCWKESGCVGRNQVLLVALRIWRDDGTIRNELKVAYIVWLGLDVLWNV